MRMHRLALLVLTVICATSGGTAPSFGAPPPEAPSALAVIARSPDSLTDALAIALRGDAPEGGTRPVAFVLDVTPNTSSQRARKALRTALRGLAARMPEVSGWWIGPLGGKFEGPAPSAAALPAHLPALLAEETDAVNTVAALSRTLDAWRAKDGIVVYLADWRFEDDYDLERFIQGLRARGRTLSVVGSEAAFERGWNDGIKTGVDALGFDEKGGIDRYFEGIGRRPFSRGNPREPWHGGDTAYPPMPYRWADWMWQTEFSLGDFRALGGNDRRGLFEDLRRALQDDDEDDEGKDTEGGGTAEPPGFEDLLRRLPGARRGADGAGGGKRREAAGGQPRDFVASFREFPLPSAWGPYALMRAAGRTGGRYVLWSWNPSGRKGVVYEYPRCNLFPPDLRPRKEILGSLASHDAMRSMMRAWWALKEVEGDLTWITPPVLRNLRTPSSIDVVMQQEGFRLRWQSRSEQERFIESARKAYDVLTRARDILERGIADGGEPQDGIDRRYQADALLLRHVVQVVRFEVGEAIAAANSIPAKVWKEGEDHHGIGLRAWILRGRDPEGIETAPGIEPRDAKAGAEILGTRKRLLERFRATPFGETIALNEVNTFRPRKWRDLEGERPDLGRSPSESSGRKEPTPEERDRPTTPRTRPTPRPRRPPGGGSSGGGPSTGR